MTATLTRTPLEVAGRGFDARDSAIFETYVAPAYLSWFAEAMLDLAIGMRDARVCHAHCRTGFPDSALLGKLPNVHLYGCDASDASLALARAKALGIKGFTADFRRASGDALPYPDGAFSHAFTIHPTVTAAARKTLLGELSRVVAPRGQALVGLPLRGSFSELHDLLREAALRYEQPAISEALSEALSGALSRAIEADVTARPSPEDFAAELEAAGFEHVDVEARKKTLRFDTGRDLLESPVLRLLVLPELVANVGGLVSEDDLASALDHVRVAVDKYWSDGAFELSITVGAASGRRPG